MKEVIPKTLAFHRQPAERPNPQLREAMIQSILSSMAKEGIDVPEDDAWQIFEEVEAAYWNQAAVPA